jgi:hypothetical protein
MTLCPPSSWIISFPGQLLVLLALRLISCIWEHLYHSDHLFLVVSLLYLRTFIHLWDA